MEYENEKVADRRVSSRLENNIERIIIILSKKGKYIKRHTDKSYSSFK